MGTQEQYIYGIHAVQEAIQSGREIEKILIGKYTRNDHIRELVTLIRQEQVPCQFVPQEKLQSYTRKNHQGVVAVLAPVIYQKLEHLIPQLYEQGELPFLVILEGVTDVRNLGAIARSAECAGVHALVIPVKGSAQVTADAIKTSSGALNSLPVCRTMNLAQSITYLKNSGLSIIGASEKADRLYFDADYTHPLALVLGSEGRGISTEIMKTCDMLLRIPVYGNISSLNVSVAGSLIVYEVVRQRRLLQNGSRTVNHQPE